MRSESSTKLYGMLSLAVAIIFPVCSLAADGKEASSDRAPSGWQRRVAAELPLLGHRNWIVVADSAYPAQSRAGIDTIYIGGDQAAAVSEVLKMVERAKHVRSIVYLDKELKSVAEADAPGVDSYRGALKARLGDRPFQTLPHESIIAKLDEAAKTFRVIILKTDCTIPYTSVFVELDCGYWSAEKEQRLRNTLDQKGGD